MVSKVVSREQQLLEKLARYDEKIPASFCSTFRPLHEVQRLEILEEIIKLEDSLSGKGVNAKKAVFAALAHAEKVMRRGTNMDQFLKPMQIAHILAEKVIDPAASLFAFSDILEHNWKVYSRAVNDALVEAKAGRNPQPILARYAHRRMPRKMDVFRELYELSIGKSSAAARTSEE